MIDFGHPNVERNQNFQINDDEAHSGSGAKKALGCRKQHNLDILLNALKEK